MLWHGAYLVLCAIPFIYIFLAVLGFSIFFDRVESTTVQGASVGVFWVVSSLLTVVYSIAVVFVATVLTGEGSYYYARIVQESVRLNFPISFVDVGPVRLEAAEHGWALYFRNHHYEWREDTGQLHKDQVVIGHELQRAEVHYVPSTGCWQVSADVDGSMVYASFLGVPQTGVTSTRTTPAPTTDIPAIQ